jgi:hypothetical protein
VRHRKSYAAARQHARALGRKSRTGSSNDSPPASQSLANRPILWVAENGPCSQNVTAHLCRNPGPLHAHVRGSVKLKPGFLWTRLGKSAFRGRFAYLTSNCGTLLGNKRRAPSLARQAWRRSPLEGHHGGSGLAPIRPHGIAIDRAQAQHPVGAMLSGVKPAENRSHRPNAQRQAGLSFLSFPIV